MTPADLQSLRATFTLAASDPHAFAVDMRRRALKLDPSLHSLLPPVERAQGAALFASFGAALDGLMSCGAIPAVAKDLARRHRLNGIQPRHLGIIGQALLDTLASHAGSAFSDAAREAWAEVYVQFAESLMAQSYNQMELVA